MTTVGQMLSAAGLAFVSAKATHRGGRIHIDEIVCETPADAWRVNAWAQNEGYPVEARVASTEELAEWKRFQEW